MPVLYATGCVRCNAAVAAALSAMPTLPGYCTAAAYIAAHAGSRHVLDYPHVDGEAVPYARCFVPGPAGIVAAIAYSAGPHTPACPCGWGEVAYHIWHGAVEMRPKEKR